MKKLYFFALVAALAMPSFAAPRRQAFIERVNKERAVRTAHAEAEKTSLWRPSEDNTYVWEGEWYLESNNKFTYDNHGNILSHTSTDVEGGVMSETTVWNEYGMRTQVLTQTGEEDSPLENSEKKVYEYDSRVHSLITACYGYMWMDSDWAQIGNNYTRTVTRNDAGNITGVELAVLFGGEFDPTERLAVEYGADGKASKISHSQLDYDGVDFSWKEDLVISDIVWDRTDGQITSVEGLFTGANRIKSATITESGEALPVEVTYEPDSESYTTVTRETVSDGEVDALCITTQKVTILDTFGSYEIVDTERYEYDGIVEEYSYVEKYHCNEYGLETLIYAAYEEEDAEPEVLQWTVGETLDDPDHGYPLEYVMRDLDTEEGEFYDMLRVEYVNYVDVTLGVGNVSVDADAAPVFYTLQGVRVDNPANGLYIERRGNTVRKVLVK